MSLDEQVGGAAMWPDSLQTSRRLDVSGRWGKLVDVPLFDQQLTQRLAGVGYERADKVCLSRICYFWLVKAAWIASTGKLNLFIQPKQSLDICPCFPPGRSWHKVI